MRHCYSTGDDLLLARNACKPHLATLLGYMKIYVLDRKFQLLCWRIKFFLSTRVKDFLTKSENSNSKFHREVWWLSPSPFSQCPLFRAGWGERTMWGKNERGTATRWVSEMLQTFFGGYGKEDGICSSDHCRKRRELLQWGLIYDAVHLKKGKEFSPSKPAQAKGFQEV